MTQTQVGIPIQQQSPINPAGILGYNMFAAGYITTLTLTAANTEYATSNFMTNMIEYALLIQANYAVMMGLGSGGSASGFWLQQYQVMCIEHIQGNVNCILYFQSATAGALVRIMQLNKNLSNVVDLGINLNKAR